MESGGYVREAKKAKPMPAADHGDGGVDRISTLPDDVIVSILRLVGDARQVVRTGALSRRWRGLWTHVPALRFHSGPRRRTAATKKTTAAAAAIAKSR
ncbi:hypothetical protein C2845_PM02G43290 [Panicum miliaceum]|uniref:F-box domain-containing protein n=1 Tax=Panicum miliaceum TaxID=4540 RepID=A0A3L6SFE9_PANMI|nr:hypothetical protein C2845_PM02G43290 [Panicum miliaceum]